MLQDPEAALPLHHQSQAWCWCMGLGLALMLSGMVVGGACLYRYYILKVSSLLCADDAVSLQRSRLPVCLRRRTSHQTHCDVVLQPPTTRKHLQQLHDLLINNLPLSDVIHEISMNTDAQRFSTVGSLQPAASLVASWSVRADTRPAVFYLKVNDLTSVTHRRARCLSAG